MSVEIIFIVFHVFVCGFTNHMKENFAYILYVYKISVKSIFERVNI